jgi:hypothetical protein
MTPARTIQERLRMRTVWNPGTDAKYDELCQEAAAHIDALERRVGELTEGRDLACYELTQTINRLEASADRNYCDGALQMLRVVGAHLPGLDMLKPGWAEIEKFREQVENRVSSKDGVEALRTSTARVFEETRELCAKVVDGHADHEAAAGLRARNAGRFGVASHRDAGVEVCAAIATKIRGLESSALPSPTGRGKE